MLSGRSNLALVVVVALALGLAAAAVAQQQDNAPRVSLELRGVTVSNALQALFKMNRGSNFVVESGSDAMIQHVKLSDIPFAVAMKRIVGAAGLTYRMVDGIYVVSQRQAPAVAVIDPSVPPIQVNSPPQAAVALEPKTVTEKIPLLYTDVYDMASTLSGQAGTRANGFQSSTGGGMASGGYGSSSYGSSGYGTGGYSGGAGYGNNSGGGGGYSGYRGPQNYGGSGYTPGYGRY